VGSERAVPVDRGPVALAGVRAARYEVCRANRLLRRAIALAATQDVAPEALARAAGTSVERVRRIAAEPDGAGRSAGPSSRSRGPVVTVLQRLEGSAYRDGGMVCPRVVVTVVTDAPSARHILVRFVDGVDQQLRGELQRLTARRGMFAIRLAERLDPIEIVGWDAHGVLLWRLVGRLERPTAPDWPPTNSEFWLRESTEPTTRSRYRVEPAGDRLRPVTPPHGRR